MPAPPKLTVAVRAPCGERGHPGDRRKHPCDKAGVAPPAMRGAGWESRVVSSHLPRMAISKSWTARPIGVFACSVHEPASGRLEKIPGGTRKNCFSESSASWLCSTRSKGRALRPTAEQDNGRFGQGGCGMIPYTHIPDFNLRPLPIHPNGLLAATGVLVGTSLTTRRARALGYTDAAPHVGGRNVHRRHRPGICPGPLRPGLLSRSRASGRRHALRGPHAGSIRLHRAGDLSLRARPAAARCGPGRRVRTPSSSKNAAAPAT
jgi:hypothetical protein